MVSAQWLGKAGRLWLGGRESGRGGRCLILVEIVSEWVWAVLCVIGTTRCNGGRTRSGGDGLGVKGMG